MSDDLLKFIEKGLLKALDSRNEFLSMAEEALTNDDQAEACLLLSSPLFDDNTDQAVSKYWSTLILSTSSILINRSCLEDADLLLDKLIQADPSNFKAAKLKQTIYNKKYDDPVTRLDKVKYFIKDFIEIYYKNEFPLFDSIWVKYIEDKPGFPLFASSLSSQLAMADDVDLNKENIKCPLVLHSILSVILPNNPDPKIEDIKEYKSKIIYSITHYGGTKSDVEYFSRYIDSKL